MMQGKRERERDREKIQMFVLVRILKSTLFSSSLSLKVSKYNFCKEKACYLHT